jgi:GntR family transcriptional regulator
MLFHVDQASVTSLANQIAIQIRAGIVHGELTPGERLPPARELAAALEVNMHTVLRAYAQLRDEGVIQMRQGRGAWISDTAGTDVLRLNELVVQLMAEARKLGVTASEVMRLVERA